MGTQRPMQAGIWKERFDESASTKEDDSDMSLWSGHSLARRMKVFLRLFIEQMEQPGKVLDVGCGPGTYARVFERLGHRVSAVDYSAPMIEAAIRKSGKSGIDYRVADVASLPFDDGSFDACVCIGVLQYVDGEEEAVKEMARVTAKDGMLFVCTLNSMSIREYSQKFYRWLTGRNKEDNDGISEKRYNPYKLANRMESYGLVFVSIDPIFILPERLYRIERLLDRTGVFTVFGRMPFSEIFAHSFIIRMRA